MSEINPLDPYEEFNNGTSIDLSSKNVETFPKIVTKIINAIYLQNNNIKIIPEDLFPSCPNLVWLDLRCNQLESIPSTIKDHPSLTHLLLQNNKITSLPDELGTVMTLKVLQLSGNPFSYPPKEIISAGTSKILTFLYNNFIVSLHILDSQSLVSECEQAGNEGYTDARSYNSVLDVGEIKDAGQKLSVKFNDRKACEYYEREMGKCPKLAGSRHITLTAHSQSSKYLKPVKAADKKLQERKLIESQLRDDAVKKKKEFIQRSQKIIQHRKNLECLKSWRTNYRSKQLFKSHDNKNYADLIHYPYDTNAEYMTFLTREDIEKDLPDKYRKRIVRRSKPTVPRKSSNDIHLAMKIKKLFENLESIDLDKRDLTPRTEQKVLLNEIQKISEIKQKLAELSLSNTRSVDEI